MAGQGRFALRFAVVNLGASIKPGTDGSRDLSAIVSIAFGLLACRDRTEGCSQRSPNRNTNSHVLHGSAKGCAEGCTNANAGTH